MGKVHVQMITQLWWEDKGDFILHLYFETQIPLKKCEILGKMW